MIERRAPDLGLEIPLWQCGYTLVAGLDEAGRGAWAGPVAAAAVVLPASTSILSALHGVRDSKQMTPRQRELWAVCIRQLAAAWGVGFATHAEIDAAGIVPATRLAMQRALEQLECPPQYLLLDAVRLSEVQLPQFSLYKGDVRSLSIAAASVLAKTSRDALLCEVDAQYPAYGFARHKGYGTRLHCAALQEHGACPIHRMSFAPLVKLRKSGGLIMKVKHNM